MDPYFHRKAIQEANDLDYWSYLADAQVRAGIIGPSLQTVDKALWYPNPYASRHVLQSNLQSVSSPSRVPYRSSIVAAKRGDINGDGVIDNVFLTANKTPDSPFWKNVTLVIRDGRTNRDQQISFKNNAGYNPTLFLGDFTGNKADDILVAIDTGGSGGAVYAYVFSSINGQMRQIFNSDAFNEDFKYNVAYQNQYKAAVISYKLNETYILDLTYKGREYLTEIYNKNGVLKTPIEGWVNPLSGLYPVDFNRDGTYDLEAYQRIAGRYNADSLGFVQTVLKWNGRAFSVDRQNVSILGGDVS
ncbi:VCBS repeat-containing protein [Bacillus sp. HU-1818]|nr:VCBS repeat-containing protein [Bacillus sp. HU-1818]